MQYPDGTGWADLDDIELFDPVERPLPASLFGPAGPVPSADEMSDEIKHQAGLSDPPPRRRTWPSTRALRDELGR